MSDELASEQYITLLSEKRWVFVETFQGFCGDLCGSHFGLRVDGNRAAEVIVEFDVSRTSDGMFADLCAFVASIDDFARLTLHDAEIIQRLRDAPLLKPSPTSWRLTVEIDGHRTSFTVRVVHYYTGDVVFHKIPRRRQHY